MSNKPISIDLEEEKQENYAHFEMQKEKEIEVKSLNSENTVIETDEKTEEDYLDKLEDYIDNPKQLEFTTEEEELLLRSGLMDKETARVMIKTINEQIDEYNRNPNDEDAYLYNKEFRKEYILNVLHIKKSLKDYYNTVNKKEVRILIDDAFNLVFPKYKEEGPSFVLKEFLVYLNDRLKDKEFLYKEVTDFKKIKNILESTKDRIFNHIPNFKLEHFISFVFNSNKSQLSLLVNEKIDSLTLKHVESIIIVFTMLFLRFFYKNYSISDNIINKQLFLKLINDINIRKDGEPITESINKNMDLIFKTIMSIIVESDQLNNIVT